MSHVTAQPAPWYMVVQPSEVDPHEEERPTGLLVAHSHDHTDDCANKLKRGVILAVGAGVNQMCAPADDSFDFEVGDVIFYHRGVTLRGLEYVYPSWDNVIAYEKNSEAAHA